MLFERIESEGLAHYSYLIGDKNEALVIDPRRDCEIYVEKANSNGYRITDILETHRNEDYLIGSIELAERTGARIWHADGQLKYNYGESVEDGQIWKIGRLKLKAIHSPGHTPGSMSYLLHDTFSSPWMVFTGDALFAGDVGRVDLLGMDRANEMAESLYETLFNKLIPLGNDIIVCPAHGAGSVCGDSIAERVWTTIGLERKMNPKLQYKNKVEFIKNIAKEHEFPPYFKKMEELNVEGAPFLGQLPAPIPLSPEDFASKADESLVLDTRMELGFGSAHVPHSLSIWSEGLPSFAGWFIPYNKQIILVNETNNPLQITKYLVRLGYDKLVGYLSGGMLSWHMSGLESNSIRTLNVQGLCKLIDSQDNTWILDVRSDKEIKSSGQISNAQHIHVTQLKENYGQVPKNRTIFIFCGSGLRSMIAASLLRLKGWEDLVVVLGGLSGWKSKKCPIKR